MDQTAGRMGIRPGSGLEEYVRREGRELEIRPELVRREWRLAGEILEDRHRCLSRLASCEVCGDDLNIRLPNRIRWGQAVLGLVRKFLLLRQKREDRDSEQVFCYVGELFCRLVGVAAYVVLGVCPEEVETEESHR